MTDLSHEANVRSAAGIPARPLPGIEPAGAAGGRNRRPPTRRDPEPRAVNVRFPGCCLGRYSSPSIIETLVPATSVTSLYNTIGHTYSRGRQSDPRIAAAIESALGNCETILNVGAGTGSYEPRSRMVVAVEPSITMIAQRPAGAAPVVQACAEALPFRNGSFDAVLGILTVHHWEDQAKGFSECVRLARSRVVFATNDFDVCAKFWLFDYFPELLRADRHIFPSMARFVGALGPVETIAVPVPSDCRDGFLGAYWQRPRAYLDPFVRGNISTFSKIGNIDSQLACLKGDIESGAWQRRYPSLEGLGTLDLGYRIVIARRDGVG